MPQGLKPLVDWLL